MRPREQFKHILARVQLLTYEYHQSQSAKRSSRWIDFDSPLFFVHLAGNQSRPKIFDLSITKPDVLYQSVVEVEERYDRYRFLMRN